MEALENFCSYCLRMAKQTPSEAKIFMHQAFGAVSFYLIGRPDEETNEIAIMWENYIEKFVDIMLGK